MLLEFLEEKMQMFDFSQIQAKHLLHHRGEIVLIDRVLSICDEEITTQSSISSSYPFLKKIGDKEVFPSYQSIELIAQSLGCFQKLQKEEICQKPKIGFLLSVRNFVILIPYVESGSTLITQVKITTTDENGFGVCEGKIYLNELQEDSLVCHSNVSVLSPKGDFRDFLKDGNG